MYTIPQLMANEIASTQNIRHPFIKSWMEANAADAERLENETRQYLQELGYSPAAAQAFIMTAPLYLESEAIADYKTMNEIIISPILPEVLTIDEALAVAKMELPGLTEKDLHDLREIYDKKLLQEGIED